MGKTKKEGVDEELGKLIEDIETFHQEEYRKMPIGVFIGLVLVILMAIAFIWLLTQ